MRNGNRSWHGRRQQQKQLLLRTNASSCKHAWLLCCPARLQEACRNDRSSLGPFAWLARFLRLGLGLSPQSAPAGGKGGGQSCPTLICQTPAQLLTLPTKASVAVLAGVQGWLLAGICFDKFST